jgi:ATP-binding cassette subfamily F protein uup
VIARVDKQLERIAAEEASLNERMAAAASDYEELARVAEELRTLAEEKETLELEWLEAATVLE